MKELAAALRRARRNSGASLVANCDSFAGHEPSVAGGQNSSRGQVILIHGKGPSIDLAPRRDQLFHGPGKPQSYSARVKRRLVRRLSVWDVELRTYRGDFNDASRPPDRRRKGREFHSRKRHDAGPPDITPSATGTAIESYTTKTARSQTRCSEPVQAIPPIAARIPLWVAWITSMSTPKFNMRWIVLNGNCAQLRLSCRICNIISSV